MELLNIYGQKQISCSWNGKPPTIQPPPSKHQSGNLWCVTSERSSRKYSLGFNYQFCFCADGENSFCNERKNHYYWGYGVDGARLSSKVHSTVMRGNRQTQTREITITYNEDFFFLIHSPWVWSNYGLPKEAVESPSLEMFKTQLEKSLSTCSVWLWGWPLEIHLT